MLLLLFHQLPHATFFHDNHLLLHCCSFCSVIVPHVMKLLLLLVFSHEALFLLLPHVRSCSSVVFSHEAVLFLHEAVVLFVSSCRVMKLSLCLFLLLPRVMKLLLCLFLLLPHVIVVLFVPHVIKLLFCLFFQLPHVKKLLFCLFFQCHEAVVLILCSYHGAVASSVASRHKVVVPLY